MSNASNDVIFNTVIFTDGDNLFPKPAAFENDQLDSFLDNDPRWKEINVRIGTQNRIFYDTQTIDEDGAWIVCTGPIPVSEEKLRQIVNREKREIWHRRSYQNYLAVWKSFFNPEKTM